MFPCLSVHWSKYCYSRHWEDLTGRFTPALQHSLCFEQLNKINSKGLVLTPIPNGATKYVMTMLSELYLLGKKDFSSMSLYYAFIFHNIWPLWDHFHLAYTKV